ncbi:hypothetical protein U14_03465 [Candidatus Moduliflexus flocculans]|uniref:Uncharacterized protein n=1 Tax=Candidatus Moduliflexus flocculans TaxID=1499966 RepID=A0A081BP98_9BACT|nr:hypothetical protein U14_03465 [Candidatus Moduliflexus flocculans]
MRKLPMDEFPSWEGQGVGSLLKLHIAFHFVSFVCFVVNTSYLTYK